VTAVALPLTYWVKRAAVLESSETDDRVDKCRVDYPLGGRVDYPLLWVEKINDCLDWFFHCLLDMCLTLTCWARGAVVVGDDCVTAGTLPLTYWVERAVVPCCLVVCCLAHGTLVCCLDSGLI
jgi:hypothetical protein